MLNRCFLLKRFSGSFSAFGEVKCKDAGGVSKNADSRGGGGVVGAGGRSGGAEVRGKAGVDAGEC
jgi:hypothetical protein